MFTPAASTWAIPHAEVSQGLQHIFSKVFIFLWGRFTGGCVITVNLTEVKSVCWVILSSSWRMWSQWDPYNKWGKLYIENFKGRSPPRWKRKTGLTLSLYLAPKGLYLIVLYRAATEPHRKLLPTCTCCSLGTWPACACNYKLHSYISEEVLQANQTMQVYEGWM